MTDVPITWISWAYIGLDWGDQRLLVDTAVRRLHPGPHPSLTAVLR